jgi:hypothetical protein
LKTGSGPNLFERVFGDERDLEKDLLALENGFRVPIFSNRPSNAVIKPHFSSVPKIKPTPV